MDQISKADSYSADPIANIAACKKERAIKYGTEYADDYHVTVYFFSAPDYETEYVGGGITQRCVGRLWLWTTECEAFDDDRAWRHELTYTPVSSSNQAPAQE